MPSALYRGADLTAQLTEKQGSPERSKSLDKDQVVRKYTTRFGSVESLLPALGTSTPAYPNHKLTSFKYGRTGEGDLTEVTLTYETVDIGSIINPDAPLPPDEVEYIGAVTERHIGAHPSYDPAWIGTPKTDNGSGTQIADPRGNILTTTPTKPGLESYWIPTCVYRKVSYTHTRPAVSNASLATRNIPAGESGDDKWLKTGFNLKITKGVYQLSEEWMYLPIGTWDTNIYA
jgi:hypothetical protein